MFVLCEKTVSYWDSKNGKHETVIRCQKYVTNWIKNNRNYGVQLHNIYIYLINFCERVVYTRHSKWCYCTFLNYFTI